jgi:adenosylhomocysteine nucleosidase
MSELPDILVVMALRAESQNVFEHAGVPVLFCGVGKVNAAISLTRELGRYERANRPPPLVVNFGSAGSPEHPTGTFVSCHEFSQRDMDVRGLGFSVGVTPFDEAPATLSFRPVFIELPTARCGSGDSFVTSSEAAVYGVVDMEAYALAKVCLVHGAEFVSVKYVTDGADHAAAGDWQANVHKAADEFLRLYRTLEATPRR